MGRKKKREEDFYRNPTQRHVGNTFELQIGQTTHLVFEYEEEGISFHVREQDLTVYIASLTREEVRRMSNCLLYVSQFVKEGESDAKKS